MRIMVLGGLGSFKRTMIGSGLEGVTKEKSSSKS